jgi:ParB-like chromosome segregation protein Spo0J
VTFGLTKQGATNILKLLDLDDRVQKAVEKGQISASAAILLTDLPREEQVAKAAEMIASGGTGVAEAKRQRKARKNGKPTQQNGSKVSVTVLRKVIENEDFMDGLSEDARCLLHWILGGGEGYAKRVKGLTAIVRGDDEGE